MLEIDEANASSPQPQTENSAIATATMELVIHSESEIDEKFAPETPKQELQIDTPVVSQRSRRSAGGGGNSGTLNPAMIHFLDLGRLKRELEARGLSTRGNKQQLADLLEETVRNERNGVHLPTDFSPAETKPRQRERGTKRKAAEIEVPPKNDDDDLKFVRAALHAGQNEEVDMSALMRPIKIMWAKEAPVNVLDKAPPLSVRPLAKTPSTLESNVLSTSHEKVRKDKHTHTPKTTSANRQSNATTKAEKIAKVSTPRRVIPLKQSSVSLEEGGTSSGGDEEVSRQSSVSSIATESLGSAAADETNSSSSDKRTQHKSGSEEDGHHEKIAFSAPVSLVKLKLPKPGSATAKATKKFLESEKNEKPKKTIAKERPATYSVVSTQNTKDFPTPASTALKLKKPALTPTVSVPAHQQSKTNNSSEKALAVATTPIPAKKLPISKTQSVKPLPTSSNKNIAKEKVISPSATSVAKKPLQPQISIKIPSAGSGTSDKTPSVTSGGSKSSSLTPPVPSKFTQVTQPTVPRPILKRSDTTTTDTAPPKGIMHQSNKQASQQPSGILKKSSFSSQPGVVGPSSIVSTSTAPHPLQSAMKRRTSTGSGNGSTSAGMHNTNIFDTIISSQDQLLADKYRSEEERLAELEQIEMEKRRKSGTTSLLGPLVRQPKSIPHPSPSQTVVQKQPPTGPSPTDPLNLLSMAKPPPPPPTLPPSSTTSEEKQLTGLEIASIKLPPPPPPATTQKDVPPPPPAKKTTPVTVTPTTSSAKANLPPAPPPRHLQLPPPPPPPPSTSKKPGSIALPPVIPHLHLSAQQKLPPPPPPPPRSSLKMKTPKLDDETMQEQKPEENISTMASALVEDEIEEGELQEDERGEEEEEDEGQPSALVKRIMMGSLSLEDRRERIARANRQAQELESAEDDSTRAIGSTTDQEEEEDQTVLMARFEESLERLDADENCLESLLQESEQNKCDIELENQDSTNISMGISTNTNEMAYGPEHSLALDEQKGQNNETEYETEQMQELMESDEGAVGRTLSIVVDKTVAAIDVEEPLQEHDTQPTTSETGEVQTSLSLRKEGDKKHVAFDESVHELCPPYSQLQEQMIDEDTEEDEVDEVEDSDLGDPESTLDGEEEDDDDDDDDDEFYDNDTQIVVDESTGRVLNVNGVGILHQRARTSAPSTSFGVAGTSRRQRLNHVNNVDTVPTDTTNHVDSQLQNDIATTSDEASASTSDNVTTSANGASASIDGFHKLLKDPKALIKRASDVLKKFDGTQAVDDETAQIEQVPLDKSYSDSDDDIDKPLPDFHGEPVPDDDEDDDALFEIAAGIRPKKQRGGQELELEIIDEPLAAEDSIELDYYNADLNIKAANTNKWLIEPDNADGFALVWGGVRSNYGIAVPSPSVLLKVGGGELEETEEEMVDYEQQQQMDAEEEIMDESGEQRTVVRRLPKAKKTPTAIAFQIKVIELLSLKHLPFEEADPYQVRIGWSRAGTSNMLGEAPFSFAYTSMAQKATNKVFTDYGETFGVEDVITTVFDFLSGEIRFYKNGASLGAAAFRSLELSEGDIFFPHVATKNCKVLVNFGLENPELTDEQRQKPVDGEKLDDLSEDSLWRLPIEEERTTRMVGRLKQIKGRQDTGVGLFQLHPSLRPPPDKTHCTIIVMVGLPGVGKTTWVRQYLKDHPEEHWVLLNTDTVMGAMTVNGLPRSRVHRGRWDMVMGLTAKALNRCLQMACRRRHNYILDQSNVSRDARKRKLTQFKDFQRKCVVIIPNEDEHERRLLKQSRQADSMQIPAEAMLEMKGMFLIPCTEQEPIEDVIFVEPPISRVNEAIEQVKRYNDEGRPWVRDRNRRTDRPASLISDNRNEQTQWAAPGVGTVPGGTTIARVS